MLVTEQRLKKKSCCGCVEKERIVIQKKSRYDLDPPACSSEEGSTSHPYDNISKGKEEIPIMTIKDSNQDISIDSDTKEDKNNQTLTEHENNKSQETKISPEKKMEKNNNSEKDENPIVSEEKLIEILKSMGCYETPANIQKRRDAISNLNALVQGWIRSISLVRGFHWRDMEKTGGQILTYGSFMLGIPHQGSDLDAICVAPQHVLREDFFTSFFDELKKQPKIKELRAIPEAFVPVIKLRYDGIEMDLTFAKLNVPELPEDLESYLYDIDPRVLDISCVRSLNGFRSTSAVLKLIQDSGDAFRVTLMVVKQWAKSKGIYSNSLGYLGGFAWAVLVAKIVFLHPEARPDFLIREFFRTFSAWPWPSPVTLRHEIHGDHKNKHPECCDIEYKNAIHGSIMPILTPVQPYINATHNVTYTTAALIKDELKKAAEITQKNEQMRVDAFTQLFKRNHVFDQFDHFLLVIAQAQEHIKWFGLIECKMRLFVGFVEKECSRHVDLVRVWPHPYTKRGIPTRQLWLVGLEFHDTQSNLVKPKAEKKVVDAVTLDKVQKGVTRSLNQFQELLDRSARSFHQPDMKLRAHPVHKTELTSVLSKDEIEEIVSSQSSFFKSSTSNSSSSRSSSKSSSSSSSSKSSTTPQQQNGHAGPNQQTYLLSSSPAPSSASASSGHPQNSMNYQQPGYQQQQQHHQPAPSKSPSLSSSVSGVSTLGEQRLSSSVHQIPHSSSTVTFHQVVQHPGQYQHQDEINAAAVAAAGGWGNFTAGRLRANIAPVHAQMQQQQVAGGQMDGNYRGIEQFVSQMAYANAGGYSIDPATIGPFYNHYIAPAREEDLQVLASIDQQLRDAEQRGLERAECDADSELNSAVSSTYESSSSISGISSLKPDEHDQEERKLRSRASSREKQVVAATPSDLTAVNGGEAAVATVVATTSTTVAVTATASAFTKDRADIATVTTSTTTSSSVPSIVVVQPSGQDVVQPSSSVDGGGQEKAEIVSSSSSSSNSSYAAVVTTASVSVASSEAAVTSNNTRTRTASVPTVIHHNANNNNAAAASSPGGGNSGTTKANHNNRPNNRIKRGATVQPNMNPFVQSSPLHSPRSIATNLSSPPPLTIPVPVFPPNASAILEIVRTGALGTTGQQLPHHQQNGYHHQSFPPPPQNPNLEPPSPTPSSVSRAFSVPPPNMRPPMNNNYYGQHQQPHPFHQQQQQQQNFQQQPVHQQDFKQFMQGYNAFNKQHQFNNNNHQNNNYRRFHDRRGGHYNNGYSNHQRYFNQNNDGGRSGASTPVTFADTKINGGAGGGPTEVAVSSSNAGGVEIPVVSVHTSSVSTIGGSSSPVMPVPVTQRRFRHRNYGRSPPNESDGGGGWNRGFGGNAVVIPSSPPGVGAPPLFPFRQHPSMNHYNHYVNHVVNSPYHPPYHQQGHHVRSPTQVFRNFGGNYQNQNGMDHRNKQSTGLQSVNTLNVPNGVNGGGQQFTRTGSIRSTSSNGSNSSISSIGANNNNNNGGGRKNKNRFNNKAVNSSGGNEVRVGVETNGQNGASAAEDSSNPGSVDSGRTGRSVSISSDKFPIPALVKARLNFPLSTPPPNYFQGSASSNRQIRNHFNHQNNRSNTNTTTVTTEDSEVTTCLTNNKGQQSTTGTENSTQCSSSSNIAGRNDQRSRTASSSNPGELGDSSPLPIHRVQYNQVQVNLSLNSSGKNSSAENSLNGTVNNNNESKTTITANNNKRTWKEQNRSSPRNFTRYQKKKALNNNKGSVKNSDSEDGPVFAGDKKNDSNNKGQKQQKKSSPKNGKRDEEASADTDSVFF